MVVPPIVSDSIFTTSILFDASVNAGVIQTYYRASTHQGVFSDGTIMSKLLGKRWNLRFSILNLLLLMVAASVVIFATVREIHYEKTRTQLENRISDLESTNKAKLQQLNSDLLDQIKKEFKAKRDSASDNS